MLSVEAQTLKLRATLSEAAQIATDLERGQAESPLAEHFSAISREWGETPFTLMIFGADAAAREHFVLDWLGDNFRAVVAVPAPLHGMIELNFGHGGFRAQSADGAWQVFDRFESLLAAINSEAAPAISMPKPAGSTRFALLIPQHCTSDIFESQANLFGRVDLVVYLRGDEPSQLSLLSAFPAVQPVSVEAAAGGFSLHGHCVQLPNRADTGAGFLQEFLAERSVPARELLFAWARLPRIRQAVLALQLRVEQTGKQIALKRQREEQGSKGDGVQVIDPGFRRPFDQLKGQIQEDVQALMRGAVESSRRGLLPAGPLTQALAEHLQQLRADDLRQEAGNQSVRLSVDPEFLQHFQRSLRRSLREELRKDLQQITDGLALLRQGAETQLQQLTQKPISLAAAAPSETDVWQRMNELLAVDIRYRGEMPKRGFLQRLGEGRKIVFAVMMILSLVGSMVGLNWRGMAVFGIGFLLLFFGAVFYTFRSWRREDAERLETEVVRVREQLEQEARRLIGEVQKEKQAKLAEALEQNKRTLLARIDDALREATEQEQSNQVASRDKARARLKRLDQQLRELQQIQPRMIRLNSELTAVENELTRNAREALAAGLP